LSNLRRSHGLGIDTIAEPRPPSRWSALRPDAAGTTSLTVTGLPANSSSAFSANPVSVPAANTSTLTVTTSSATKQGSYTPTVSASSGSLLHSTTVVLQVKPK